MRGFSGWRRGNFEKARIASFELYACAAEDLPFASDSFDVAVCNLSLNFWLFRNSCGRESGVCQSPGREVEPAEMKEDSHSEAFPIAKPAGHFLHPLNASVLCL